jgi:cell division protein FtsB
MNLPGWDHKTLRRCAIFVLALICVLIFVDEIFGPNGYVTLRRQKKEYTGLQQQIHTLSEQNQQLEQKIKALKNNPDAVEKQARDQLHLAKPGELIYMLPDKEPAQPPATAQQISPAQSKPLR